jgi:hypothetical protein
VREASVGSAHTPLGRVANVMIVSWFRERLGITGSPVCIHDRRIRRVLLPPSRLVPIQLRKDAGAPADIWVSSI